MWRTHFLMEEDKSFLAGAARDLRNALLAYRESLLRTFTQNLLAYGLGRRVEHFDMPTVRAIVRNAGARDHRMSAYVLSVVGSPAFRMQRIESATEQR